MHKAIFKNSLCNLAAPFGNHHHRHHLRLHIGWETRIRQGFNGYGLERQLAHHAHLINILFHESACLTQLRNQRLLVLGQYIFNNYIATSHSCSNHIGSRFNAVGNNGIISTVQLLHTLNADGIGACTANFGTHFIQIVSQINNFRFLGSIFYNGNAFG